MEDRYSQRTTGSGGARGEGRRASRIERGNRIGELGPIRSCIVCRKRFRQTDLTRFAWDGESGRIVTVKTSKGRSAYLCQDPNCRAGVTERQRLDRALRATIPNEAKSNLRHEEKEC